MTEPRGMNTPQKPFATHGSQGGPKKTDDGTSHKTGYKDVTAKGESPKAVAQNPSTGGRK